MKSPRLSLALLAALALATAGCQKFLDQPVLGQYEAGQFFTSNTNAVLAVNAAYVPLSFRDAASNPLWVLGDVASDDAVKGSNPGDQADFENIDNFNITPTNAAVEAMWKRYYDGIFRCNVVTDGLPASNAAVSAEVRQQVLGQARFLRAYYYFQLTTIYGRIPLRVKVETPEELQSPARDQAAIYAQIEADCQAAALALPNAWTGADLGRATKGAANAALKAFFEQMPAREGPELRAGMIDIANILPKSGGYFRYMGSLTTPPCSEGLTWTVHKEPVEASVEQIQKFAALFPKNARPLQKRNRRFVIDAS